MKNDNELKNNYNSNDYISDEIKFFLINLIEISFDPIFLVGGAIRDFILENTIVDYDFILKSNPLPTVKAAQKICGGTYFCLDEKLQIYRLVPSKNFLKKSKINIHFDFAMLSEKNITEDLLKRDFTINSIALKLVHFLQDKKSILSNLIDPTKGLNDISNQVIKINSQNSFIDDPLRLLRLFRLKSQLNFKIDKETLFYAKKYSNLISLSAPERRTDEIFKIFETNNSHKIFSEMNDAFILSRIFDNTPEYEKMKKNRFVFNDKNQPNVDAVLSEIFIEISESTENFRKIIIKNRLSNIRSFKSLVKFVALCQIYNIPFAPDHRRIFLINNNEFNTLIKAKKFTDLYINNNNKEYSIEMIKCFYTWDKMYIEIAFISAFLISKRTNDLQLLFCEIIGKFNSFKFCKKNFSGKDLKKFGINSGPLMGELLLKIWSLCINKKITQKKEIDFIAEDLTSKN
jgi:tRNA nucleotidyltransferase/poly(A) polymerase